MPSPHEWILHMFLTALRAVQLALSECFDFHENDDLLQVLFCYILPYVIYDL